MVRILVSKTGSEIKGKSKLRINDVVGLKVPKKTHKVSFASQNLAVSG